MGVGAFLCNEKWYQSLPDDLKSAVIETEKIARQTYNRVGQELDTAALAKLKSHGMEVYLPAVQEKQLFINKARPYVRERMEQKHGKEFVADFIAAVEAAENKLNQRMKSGKPALK
ncbi:MAG: hypothetical protein ACYSX1_13690 [Planctomycetota bacterium]|jgi:C4-dicarboxylate-binding protein DctP